MVAILQTIEGGEVDTALIAHLDREPIFLYPELDDRGWSHEIHPSLRAEARTVRTGLCFAWCAGVHEHRGNLSRRSKESVIAAVDPISVLRSGGRLSRHDVAGSARRRARGGRLPWRSWSYAGLSAPPDTWAS